MIGTPADLLPSPHDTLFLRACVGDGAVAAESWHRWLELATADGREPRQALAAVNSLLPLLDWNLQRAGIDVGRALRTHLRAATFTEELRWKTYRDICGLAFRTLNDAQVPFIALKGSVVGALAYPHALFRHADDIDVLIHESDLPAAEAAMAQAGWQPDSAPTLPSPIHAPPLRHPSDVPIELHWRLMIPYYTLPYDELWARSRAVHVAGVDIRALSECDALLHACAHGMGGWAELKWVVDAWFILAKQPAFDWAVFVSTVEKARLGLPMFHALRYLADEIGARVPPHVVRSLASAAAATGRVGRAVARPWPVARLDRLPWWQRAPRLFERAFPPPVQFASHYDVPLWTVPFYYVYRVARHLGVGIRRSSAADRVRIQQTSTS